MATLRTKILKYTLLPGFLPRIHRLFASGFGYIAFLMANIYQIAGILPANHAYLNPANISRYGVRHVIAEAANHLVLEKKRADQIIIFFVILSGVVLLFAQTILFGVALVAQHPVMAGSFNPVDFLTIKSAYNPGPSQDLAFTILDRVFGVKGIFQSCVSMQTACMDLHGKPLPSAGAFPTAFQLGLHTMLRFYSMGIFIVSVIVVIYYIITITAETAETGTPFGRRFNRSWAPIRFMMCYALLVPLNIGETNAGLNGAQLVTLWSAKLGSNFATNAWGYFNKSLTETYLGNTVSLVGTPNAPKVNDIVRFMFVVRACQVAENTEFPEESQLGHGPEQIQAYIIRENQYFGPSAGSGGNAVLLANTTFENARDFSNNGNIHVRFGELNKSKFGDYKGNVKPFCGEMRLNVTSLDKGPVSGSTVVQKLYYDMIVNMWKDTEMKLFAECVRKRSSTLDHDPSCTEWPDDVFASTTIKKYQDFIKTNLKPAIDQEIANGSWAVPPELQQKGWAGAAIWYNRIAEMNGNVAAAVFSLPEASSYPYIMEVIANQRRTNNEELSADTIFDPELKDGYKINYPRGDDKDVRIAATLNIAYSFWDQSDAFQDHFSQAEPSPVLDFINSMFGTSGIFEIRRNTSIHPLAQLSTLGKGMMYAALRNLTASETLHMGGMALDDFGGTVAKIMADLLQTMAFTTMSISFILYYVLPFMPFIYFLFAVSGWVKAIFEAIVAMPLWALAHLRIDGEGLPGPGATNGYFLILEIFLRPVLIVFGLLASIQIFSALVAVMHDVFDLVEANVSGFDREAELTGIGPSKIAYYRGALDRFFYTAIYAIMCYMMGLGCFKLIDEIPNNILRWAGVSVQPLVEQAGDSAGKVVEKTYQGAVMASGQVKGGTLAALLAGR